LVSLAPSPSSFHFPFSERFYLFHFFPLQEGKQLINSPIPSHKALTMMVVDQTVFAPMFLPVYFTSLNLLKGTPTDQIFSELKLFWWPTLVANWKVWPMVSFLNFMVIPLQYRVIFVNTIGLFWNTFLAYSASRVEEKATHTPTAISNGFISFPFVPFFFFFFFFLWFACLTNSLMV